MRGELKYTEKEVEKLLSGQRGNCWVALSKLTKDNKLLQAVISSPEPGHWREKSIYRTPRLEELSYGTLVEIFSDSDKFFTKEWELHTWNEITLGFGVLGDFKNLQKLILDKQIRVKL